MGFPEALGGAIATTCKGFLTGIAVTEAPRISRARPAWKLQEEERPVDLFCTKEESRVSGLALVSAGEVAAIAMAELCV